ncbi:MAG: UMP kinase [Candidatus Woesearchaeota archaeon]
MQPVIISLGGSIITDNSEHVLDPINYAFLEDFIPYIRKLSETRQVYIVCGGGKPARAYIRALKKIGVVNENYQDEVGIAATRLNAEYIRTCFGEIAHPTVLTDPTHIEGITKPIVVSGGWKPGFSTDMVAVTLAIHAHSHEVINISNITQVYSADPRKQPDAVPFDKLSWTQYFSIVGSEWSPGMSAPFDPVASREAHARNITVKIIGANIDNMVQCIAGNHFLGTIIHN